MGEDVRNTDSKQKNGRCNFYFISNYITYKHNKHSNQKSEIGRMDKKKTTWFNYIPSVRYTL